MLGRNPLGLSFFKEVKSVMIMFRRSIVPAQHFKSKDYLIVFTQFWSIDLSVKTNGSE